MCRSVRCIIFCFWQQLNIGSPLVGWPPLRRSPVDDCVALHVVANDVATGWLAAAPPCPCCGSACCSMLLLGLCRRRSCAVAVVMLSHAFPDPPDPVHLLQSSTRTATAPATASSTTNANGNGNAGSRQTSRLALLLCCSRGLLLLRAKAIQMSSAKEPSGAVFSAAPGSEGGQGRSLFGGISHGDHRSMWSGGKRALKLLLLRWWCAVWWSVLTFFVWFC